MISLANTGNFRLLTIFFLLSVVCLNIRFQQSKAGMFTVFLLELWVFYKAFITAFSFFLVVVDIFTFEILFSIAILFIVVCMGWE